MPRVYKIDVIPDGDEEMCRTSNEKSKMWHRRMGHCFERALQYLAKSNRTRVKLSDNVKAVDFDVRAMSKRRKESLPPSDGKRLSRIFESLHIH